MARSATISPLGLYNWDNTLFDLMQIPAELDKNVLIKNLLAETAELEVLYPNPVVFKNLIALWSAKQIDIWNRLYQTTQYEYNPIENYNRYETGSEDGTGRTTHSGTDTTTDTTTHTGTNGRTEGLTTGGRDTVTGADTKGHWVAGYDAPTPTEQNDGLFKQTRDQDDATTHTDYGRTETVTETKTFNDSISKTGGLTHGEQVDSTSGTEHELHAHGNIGVMSTQQMIDEQRKIELFNIYDIIIEDFKMRFCLLIY